MTEDMITQQADVFEKLGTSESATHIRAKLQSAQLYSGNEHKYFWHTSEIFLSQID